MARLDVKWKGFHEELSHLSNVLSHLYAHNIQLAFHLSHRVASGQTSQRRIVHIHCSKLAQVLDVPVGGFVVKIFYLLSLLRFKIFLMFFCCFLLKFSFSGLGFSQLFFASLLLLLIFLFFSGWHLFKVDYWSLFNFFFFFFLHWLFRINPGFNKTVLVRSEIQILQKVDCAFF